MDLVANKIFQYFYTHVNFRDFFFLKRKKHFSYLLHSWKEMNSGQWKQKLYALNENVVWSLFFF